MHAYKLFVALALLVSAFMAASAPMPDELEKRREHNCRWRDGYLKLQLIKSHVDFWGSDYVLKAQTRAEILAQQSEYTTANKGRDPGISFTGGWTKGPDVKGGDQESDCGDGVHRQKRVWLTWSRPFMIPRARVGDMGDCNGDPGLMISTWNSTELISFQGCTGNRDWGTCYGRHQYAGNAPPDPPAFKQCPPEPPKGAAAATNALSILNGQGIW